MAERVAKEFDEWIATIISSVQTMLGELGGSARSMMAAAKTTKSNAETATASAETAASQVVSVAAASNEMAASAREVSGRTDHTRHLGQEAVGVVTRSEATIEMLIKTSHRIEEMAALIGNIASQTNLLALNATIEAARAGEARQGGALPSSPTK
jgi:methyl-accepting chemotaxis protein